MLTKELALFSWDRFEVRPDCLTRGRHAQYRDLAQRLLRIYSHGQGQTRRELHRRAERVFDLEPDCPLERIRSLIKLLDETCEFDTGSASGGAALRQQIFALAAPHHPLVASADKLFESAERTVKTAIARQLERPWPEIEAALYDDFPEFHRLVRCEGFENPDELLSRYNVAQAQALLYWAEEMTVLARADYKAVFRYAKLSGLLHEIAALAGGGYRIRFTGPLSVLKHTRRYGVNFARFLPALLACRDWEMQARLEISGRRGFFRLTSASGLHSDRPPAAEFDSQLEADFARKFGDARDGWTLLREGDILVRGQKVFVPDFVFRHEDGTTVFFEIVGYWTPEYLAAKQQTLAFFADRPILISIPRHLALAKTVDLPSDALTHGKSLRIAPILERLESLRGAARTKTAIPGR